MRLHPFRALRPLPSLAARVAAPPYDVVTREEAQRLVAGNPLSFLHVGRSDIDLPAECDPHDPRVYSRARQNLDRLADGGTLVRDARPSLYLYRQVLEGRAQIGVVGCVHVDDYERGTIKRHEATRPDKEDDRTRHVLALRAHAEPVLLMYRGRDEIDRLDREDTGRPPLFDFTAADGVRHSVWPIVEAGPYLEAYQRVECAYVADGHHRSASAVRAARELRATRPGPPGDQEHDWFPAVLFPASQLQILAYNRVVRDLAGRTTRELREALGQVGELSIATAPVPPGPGTFCFYLDRRWYRLALPPASIDRGDPVASLDVSLLQERVLGPLLGIADQRTDPRIDFVGGIRGTAALERRVDAGEAALAISMYPTTVEQLMAVADAGAMMPPKSTWFEPKLASGLFVHQFD